MARLGCGRASRNDGGDQGDDDGPGADGPGDGHATLSSRCSDFMGPSRPTLVASLPPMSAPSTALTKELEQKLPLTDHAPPAPAAAAGSQEGPAAVVAISKNGFVHPALCGFGLANEKVVIVTNLEPKSRATNRKVFLKFVRLHEKTPLGGKLPAQDGWKSYYYSTGALHFKSAVFLVELVDEGKGEGQPTQMGLSLNIDEFLTIHDTAQTLPGKDLKVGDFFLIPRKQGVFCSCILQNKVYHADSMLKGKGISGSDSSCAFSTRAAGNADVNKDAQAAPCITQVFVLNFIHYFIYFPGS